MSLQQEIDYERVEKALSYIATHFKRQPSLEEIAGASNLSVAHFQRLFTEWAGTSPKKFLQYISVNHAKQLLENKLTLFDTALETGFSSTSRLHDLFINIEGMTPAEYKNEGKDLHINYSFFTTQFGHLLIATTHKGICYMAFFDDENLALSLLKKKFANADFKHQVDDLQTDALQFFAKDWSDLKKVKLHLKGTAFQLKVWEALLKIPAGKLSTYGKLANLLNNAGASRAVGTAIGSNPIAYLIPCHRVIQATGLFGGYMWGPQRKTAIIGWEQAQVNS